VVVLGEGPGGTSAVWSRYSYWRSVWGADGAAGSDVPEADPTGPGGIWVTIERLGKGHQPPPSPTVGSALAGSGKRIVVHFQSGDSGQTAVGGANEFIPKHCLMRQLHHKQ